MSTVACAASQDQSLVPRTFSLGAGWQRSFHFHHHSTDKRTVIQKDHFANSFQTWKLHVVSFVHQISKAAITCRPTTVNKYNSKTTESGQSQRNQNLRHGLVEATWRAVRFKKSESQEASVFWGISRRKGVWVSEKHLRNNRLQPLAWTPAVAKQKPRWLERWSSAPG